MPFEVPERIALALPDPAGLARARAKFAGSAAPVRPLPSNGTVMLLSAVAFAVLAIVFATPFGLKGFARFTASGAAFEYSVILLLALELTGTAIASAIPGSRRVLSPVAGALAAVVLLSATAMLLFHDPDTHDFVRLGVPCLRLGLLTAIPGAVLVWALMRRGFVADPVPAAIAGGALAGLLGVGVLALHCPIFSAPHVIVWHVGVIAITSVAGAVAGSLAARAG